VLSGCCGNGTKNKENERKNTKDIFLDSGVLQNEDHSNAMRARFE
jgi:hypothetical protein